MDINRAVRIIFEQEENEDFMSLPLTLTSNKESIDCTVTLTDSQVLIETEDNTIEILYDDIKSLNIKSCGVEIIVNDGNTFDLCANKETPPMMDQFIQTLQSFTNASS